MSCKNLIFSAGQCPAKYFFARQYLAKFLIYNWEPMCKSCLQSSKLHIRVPPYIVSCLPIIMEGFPHVCMCVAWQQHDVQELCRVLFDALEKRFKKDEHHETSKDLINDLYRGAMKDYVKCLEVSRSIILDPALNWLCYCTH